MAFQGKVSIFKEVSPAEAAVELLNRLSTDERGRVFVCGPDRRAVRNVAAWVVSRFRITQQEAGEFLFALGCKLEKDADDLTRVRDIDRNPEVIRGDVLGLPSAPDHK